ncbi:hypothetical protein ACFL0Z_00520 [Patescibacteria group bacterium]
MKSKFTGNVYDIVTTTLACILTISGALLIIIATFSALEHPFLSITNVDKEPVSLKSFYDDTQREQNLLTQGLLLVIFSLVLVLSSESRNAQERLKSIVKMMEEKQSNL